jgi:Carboxypeptidase regulatory-like domain/TonB-dependent Receptor Plug Domain
MMSKRTMRVLAVLGLLGSSALPARAQITTGTVSGTVKDVQGGVVPGATVVLISESKGTKTAPVVTNATGDYVFPNVAADSYTVEVSMEGFKTLTRKSVKVSGGDRVVVPILTIEVGGSAETVNVSAESPMIQAASGERSFAVATEQIENLPINHTNFTSVVSLTPGVVSGGASAGGTRLGGAGQNNIMMDGISAMDTGNNGQMLNMNVESIAEVKVLTQGYQAEYGRSSGLQITAVTKSGTNRLRGSAYDIQGNSDWNTNSWANVKNGDKKPEATAKTLGYSIGGPIGKPGGNNKLFFFYSHEYRPATTYTNNGNVIRLRVPTAEERQGIFTNSLNQNGAPIPQLLDPITRQPYANNVIPASSWYSLGATILSRYPLPNVAQQPGTNYNYQIDAPSTQQLTQQPAVKIDYQLSPKLRFTGKYSGELKRALTQPGIIPGFSDSYVPYPTISNYGVTVNWVANSTTFVEANYGMIENQLAGGNENGLLTNDSANRLNGLGAFPLIYPNAGQIPTGSYAYQVMQAEKPVFWDGTSINLPPVFSWGSLIGAAPPNQRYPGWLNINRTQDVSVSLTKISGHHTFKTGFYENHSYKAQNANVSWQGNVDFGQNSNNPLDSGFGYANALLGVFNTYSQQSSFVEGSMLYNNVEGYLQDNWKVNSRLTLDLGLRLTHQQPQYDQFGQMSNFFTDTWSKSAAPTLYVPVCNNGAATCASSAQIAMDPRTGATVPNSSVLIGTPIPGSGNLTNGVVKAGDGISKYSYTWPALVFGPRFGYAYDLTGGQKIVVRGGGGWFYDRPDGNTVFSIPSNPPITSSTTMYYGQLSSLGQGGLSPIAVPSMNTFQYDAAIPTSVQWNSEVQMALPWATAVTVAYVGNHGYNRLAAFQNGNSVNLNAVDYGTAYLPQYQNTSLAASSVPGATALSTNLLRPYVGYGSINQQQTKFWDTYHSLQFTLNRRYRDGFAFGFNYTRGLSFTGNTGLLLRLQHNADGSVSIRSDQAQYEALNKNLDLRPNIIKANAMYDIPALKGTKDGGAALKAVGYVVNNWQISGVFSAGSGAAYDLSYSYNSNGGNVNITGSPDYGGRVVYTGNPGSGCSSNQYAQFDASMVKGPSYGSVGMESGRNILRNCMDKTVDMALAKNVRLGGQRNVQFRMDVFNLFNTYIINSRSTTATFDNPTSMTLQNNQFNADGSLNQSRLTPRTAGFGAATGAVNRGSAAGLGDNYNRVVMLQVRFQF